ncbi:MAG TPA: M23 family metallopeptidase [Candidatus Paceibacterota bacterium]|nr:M23 family metallopeptidase [Candidatus Paceibacterota bacterium]
MKFFLKNKNKKTTLAKDIIMSLVIFSAIVIIPLSYSQTAEASLFSFVAQIIGAGPVSADTQDLLDSSTTNSQNMSILQAVSNPNPNPNLCGDVAPVNGNILDPNMMSNCDAVNTQISTYIVNSGDTISEVAQMFHVSVNTILWANNLTSKSVLKAGQTLVILPITGITYTIKKGDTLKVIANKYGGDHPADTLSDILDYNDLTVSSSLTVGQNIIIPSAEISVSDTVRTAPRSGSQSVGAEPLLDNVKNLPTYSSCSSPASGCYFLRPIQGGHISQKLHGHNGVDLAAPVGTPITAAAGGTVIISRINGGWNGGYGNFVVVSHNNGTQTLYAHLQTKLVVSAGQQVRQGQLIGYIGMTGHTTGPHVHFEIRGAKNLFGDPTI